MEAMFLDDIANASGRRFGAVAHNVALFGGPWGFDLTDINVPVFWWHGDADNVIPLTHAEHSVKLLRAVELEVRATESHLGGFAAADIVLETLARVAALAAALLRIALFRCVGCSAVGDRPRARMQRGQGRVLRRRRPLGRDDDFAPCARRGLARSLRCRGLAQRSSRDVLQAGGRGVRAPPDLQISAAPVKCVEAPLVGHAFEDVGALFGCGDDPTRRGAPSQPPTRALLPDRQDRRSAW